MQEGISFLSDKHQFQVVEPPEIPILSFPGLEIRLHQRRVLRNGNDIPLTRLEYSTLCYLASQPGRVFPQTQIYEAVWHMESHSCHSAITNVVYNLRKKIEPDRKNPSYIKTIAGIGTSLTLKGIAEADWKYKGKMNVHTARPCISSLLLLVGN